MSQLPSDFQDLERFSSWILETETKRHAKRYASSMEEIRHFYDTMRPKLSAVCDYLNRFSLDEMPKDAHNLFLICMSLMEVTPAVEWFGRTRSVEGFDASEMVAVE